MLLFLIAEEKPVAEPQVEKETKACVSGTCSTKQSAREVNEPKKDKKKPSSTPRKTECKPGQSDC